jgi:hypothetical protein
MSISIQQQEITNSLIALKSQYERALTEADGKVNHLRDQISHVNTLLLNQLLPTKAPIKSAAPVTLDEAGADRLALAPAAAEAPPGKNANTRRKTKAVPELASALGKRIPRPLQPAYEGLTRLEAIAHILRAKPGQEMTINALTEFMFGNLSTADRKTEVLKLRTLLYQGEKRGLWRKGTAPSSYVIPSSTGEAKVSTAPVQPLSKKQPKAKVSHPKPSSSQPRISLTVLPAFDGMTKLDAIATVLEQNLGEVLHQNTIIQKLYGDLSPEDLKKERVRMDTCLRNGVKSSRWQKAPAAASYVMKTSGTKPQRDDPMAEAAEAVAPAATAAKPPKSARQSATAKASKKKLT